MAVTTAENGGHDAGRDSETNSEPPVTMDRNDRSRSPKYAHTDVTQFIEWMVVERLEDGRVTVPWAEIVVDMKLPPQLAA